MTKFKGHVKVTLRDAKTGQIDQVVEGDNIVTDAVKDLLANNVLGCVDYTKIYPVWSRWYKGCLAFEQPFTLVNGEPDPTDYFIPDDSVNHVTAHAGDVSPDDIKDDLKRGNPNTHVQVLADNLVKMVWEWGPKQGNGNVSAIALTHKDVGNAGTGANSNAFKAFQPFDPIQIGLSNFTCQMKSSENVIAQYNDHYGIWYEIGEPGDYYNEHSRFETTYITIYFKKLAFDQIGLYDTTTAVTEFDEKVTIDLGAGNRLYCQPSYYYDKAASKLHIFSNVTGINSQTGNITWKNSVDHYVITISGVGAATLTSVNTISTGRSDLAPVCIDTYGGSSWHGSRPSFHGIAHSKSGANDYWFFPCSDNVYPSYPQYNVKGYVRCGSGGNTYFDLNENQVHFASSMSGPGVTPIIMPGRILNNRVGYTCYSQFNVSETHRVLDWAFITPNKCSSYLIPIGAHAGYEMGRYIVANKMLMTTKFNLPTTVHKSASQSMTIEYTLTEV